MDPAVQGALVAGGSTALVAIAGMFVQWQQAAAARRHELHLQQLPTLADAYLRFAEAMRRAAGYNDRFAGEHGYGVADDIDTATGERHPRDEPTAENALQALRLVAGEGPLLAAARAYLEEHYEVYWGPWSGAKRRNTDLTGAEAALIAVARREIYGT